MADDLIELARRRLHNVGLTAARFTEPEQVVRRLGAVQSQDFGPAKWSLGQRCTDVDDAAVGEAFAAGRILRTHVLRPTWHFVLAEDIRWMLDLTAPRVLARTAYHERQTGVDGVLGKAVDLIGEALRGGRHLTRKGIGEELRAHGIELDGQRLGHVLGHAELVGVVCSGALDGRQHTYALLDERAPQARRLSREEALAELTLRFFTSRGPATVKDFAWWSSLTMTDIRNGLDLVAGRLQREVVDGIVYWSGTETGPPLVPPSPSALLVQGYDEYVVGFTESKHLADLSGVARSQRWDRPVFTGIVLLDGQLAGHWKRTVGADSVAVETFRYAPFGVVQQDALERAVQDHGRFLGLPATVR